jgi:hypothetical protein
MKKHITPKARKESLVVQESDNEILIYDLDSNKAVCLNETSALIWQACDGNNNVSDITALIGKQLNSPVNDDFVWLALDQLKKENLIENKEEVAIDYNGMSRREVIRKVGLASVVALPIVSSLVAPQAANAGSPAACQARTCQQNADCTSVGCTACAPAQGQGGTRFCTFT